MEGRVDEGNKFTWVTPKALSLITTSPRSKHEGVSLLVYYLLSQEGTGQKLYEQNFRVPSMEPLVVHE